MSFTCPSSFDFSAFAHDRNWKNYRKSESCLLIHKTCWARVKSFLWGASIPLSQLCILNIPSYFHKIYKFLHFRKNFKFLPIFVQFTYFCLIYFYCFTLFDHDAFMHQALHVLDASVPTHQISGYIKLRKRKYSRPLTYENVSGTVFALATLA